MTRKILIGMLSLSLLLSVAACESNKDDTLPESRSIEEFSQETDKSGQKSDVGQYAVGDIVLANGSVLKTEDLTVINSDNVPIAVIAGFKDNGIIFAVGVHRSDNPLQWAADNTTGYTTRFANTVCTQNSDDTFSGDADGNDNWNEICAADGDGTADSSKNYPAFHFVNTYAETYGLTGTYASGWYMPSIAELCTMYENRLEINAALEKIYELDHSAAMDGLTTNWYWSSSQANSEDDYAWFVHFFNGYAGECPKNFTNVHAIAIRDF